MNDPVTNALALQLEFGDDALRQEIEDRIAEIARSEYLRMLNDPKTFERFIVNNAHAFETAVVRSMKNFHNNPRNIY
jgi:hypothetical protein